MYSWMDQPRPEICFLPGQGGNVATGDLRGRDLFLPLSLVVSSSLSHSVLPSLAKAAGWTVAH